MTDVSRPRLVVAVLAGVAAVAGSFALGGRTPLFVGAQVASLFTAAAPGMATQAAIAELGDLAQVLLFAVALVAAAGLFAAVARVALVLGDRSEVPYTAAMAGFAGSLVVAFALTGRVEGSLAAAAPPAVVLAGAERRWKLPTRRPSRASRRAVLRGAGAVAAFAGLSYLRGREIVGAVRGPLSRVTDESVESTASERVAAADAASLPVDGLEPLVSTDFYEVDINYVDPNPTPARWSLSVTGAVERELELGYDDLLGMDLTHRFETLRCVGDPVNGKKLDNALWTGVPVADLLAEAGPTSDCNCVMLRAADGYYEEFPLEALRPGFLALGMNGDILPRAHGYPLRALVPGHWGEVSVKWLTEIELLEREAQGYWEKKGWHGTGPVETVAKLHVVNHSPGAVELAGHAYAGTRGVSAVEVSTDGGETWREARLSESLPGQDVWRQWVHEFEPTRDRHEVVVRAVEADGTVQPEAEADPYPRGASGWVRETVERQE